MKAINFNTDNVYELFINYLHGDKNEYFTYIGEGASKAAFLFFEETTNEKYIIKIEKDYYIDEILNDPVGIVKEFVNKYNVTLLLKGPTTIIANKDDMYFSTTGTPGMATAGSGDVLTGILSGVLGYTANILDSVALGAYINGLSGEIAENEYSDISMVSSDTARCVSKAIKRIVNS